MDNNRSVKHLLADLAVVLDSPEGQGGGAIALAAIAAIEDQEAIIRRLQPPQDAPRR